MGERADFAGVRAVGARKAVWGEGHGVGNETREGKVPTSREEREKWGARRDV